MQDFLFTDFLIFKRKFDSWIIRILDFSITVEMTPIVFIDSSFLLAGFKRKEIFISSLHSKVILIYLENMKKTLGTHNYYVYILTNVGKTVLYVGVTNNLKDRLYYHNNPEANSKHFTHRYKCKYLIYFEHFFDVETAITREKQLKKWRREKKEKLINRINSNWEFLNNTI